MARSPRSVLIPLMFLAVALSGCVETDASRGAAIPTESGPAVVSETTGGIDGQVMDDEQLAVQGASIGIRSAGGAVGNQTTSAADGTFSFSALEPGEHELVAQSPFHKAATKRVSVIAGESQSVTFVLQPTAAPVERLVETLALRGHIACSVGWRNPSNDAPYGNPVTSNPCYQNQGDKSDFKVPVNLELPFTEMVLELVWQPGTGFSGSRLRMEFCSEKPDENNYFAQCKIVSGSNPYGTAETGPSPLIMRRNPPIESVTEYEVAIGDGAYDLEDPSTARVPVTFQQNFDLWMSLCYYSNCTVDFQARPPG